MIYTEQTKKAMKLAYDKHNGQVDKDGIPYIFHPWHLAEQMDDEDSIVVALLHDVVEDTDITLKNLEEMGFNQRVIDALSVLTHDKGVDYYDYIKKVATNQLAIKVKIADLKHNSDYSRLTTVTEKDLQKLVKYKNSLEFLQSLENKRLDDTNSTNKSK